MKRAIVLLLAVVVAGSATLSAQGPKLVGVDPITVLKVE
jgi:hypothetical protein